LSWVADLFTAASVKRRRSQREGLLKAFAREGRSRKRHPPGSRSHGQSKRAGQTERQRATSQTGRQRATSQTRRQRATSQTGRQRSTSQTGRQRATSQTGRQRSTSQTGRQRATSQTRRQRSTSQTGRQRATSQTRRQRSTSQTGSGESHGSAHLWAKSRLRHAADVDAASCSQLHAVKRRRPRLWQEWRQRRRASVLRSISALSRLDLGSISALSPLYPPPPLAASTARKYAPTRASSSATAGGVSRPSAQSAASLRAEHANLRAGRWYCAVSSELRVNTRDAKTVNTADYS